MQLHARNRIESSAQSRAQLQNCCGARACTQCASAVHVVHTVLSCVLVHSKRVSTFGGMDYWNAS